MTTYELNLARLCRSIRETINQDSANFSTQAESLQNLLAEITSSDIPLDLEIGFRTVVDEIYNDKEKKKSDADVSFTIPLYLPIILSDSHIFFGRYC